MVEVTRIKPHAADLARAALSRAYHRKPAEPARLLSMLSDPNFVLLVGIKDGDPIAYLHAELIGRLDGRMMMLIYEVTVAAEERRRGIGSALMAAAFSIADEAGAVRCWLLTETDNVAAVKFYESLGGDASPAVGYSWTLR